MEENYKFTDRFILCDGEDDGILIRKFYGDEELYFSIYSYGQFKSKPSLLNRIGFALRHIWIGKIYGEQIILSEEKAFKLRDYINDFYAPLVDEKPILPKLNDGEIYEYKDGFGYWYPYTTMLQESKSFLPFKLRKRNINGTITEL